MTKFFTAIKFTKIMNQMKKTLKALILRNLLPTDPNKE